ncbi:hypothetical protein [Roseateles toxinivorans]|uniref:SH3 domain-containing protein n=1 Tax=Roseateles toxinivorans TaxID=270368 RepID=A0A4R6QM52_9BURK|nr:hypothetical protein [Roseateles toxinivorans]TDP63305.1 hypothetical protein DES47_105310 [Roseateles toxinivorans]
MRTTTSSIQPARRRFTVSALGLAGLLLAGCSAPALAQENLVSLEVFDRDADQLLPVYAKDQRQYVAGRPGARYALRLRNLTGGRVLAVLSVDGINVISGQTAGWAQTGYVLAPYESYDIRGWRKSDAEVAAFQFAAITQSYAAQTGRPGHVGVIGVAAFREKAVPPPVIESPPLLRSDAEARDRAAPAPSAAPMAGATAMQEKSAPRQEAAAKLGTAHGERETSYTSHTRFERASSRPQSVVQLEYDSLDRLVAAGIVPSRWAQIRPSRPRPFPVSDNGYVPDPPSR